jgi:hypothetical protein
LSKIQNLKHKYGATRAQLLKKVDGAQSSIEKKFIPPMDIVVELNASLKGLEKPLTILDP